MVKKVTHGAGDTTPPNFRKEVSLFLKNLAVRLTGAAISKIERDQYATKEHKAPTVASMKKAHTFQVGAEAPKRHHEARLKLPVHLHPGLAKPLNHRVAQINEFEGKRGF